LKIARNGLRKQREGRIVGQIKGKIWAFLCGETEKHYKKYSGKV
jgi:hypothetical protein